MNYRLLTTVLAFSLACLAGPLMAMEKTDEEWGANLECSHKVKFKSQGDIFTLSIKDTTGLSGRISVPKLSIIDFPNVGEAEPYLKKMLTIEANELYINGTKTTNFQRFSPKVAKPEHYKLILNNVDISQPLKLTFNPVQKGCRDIYKLIPPEERVERFVKLLKYLQKEASHLKKVDGHKQFWWPNGAKVSEQGKSLYLSRVSGNSWESTLHADLFSKKEITTKTRVADTLKDFQDNLRNFISLFNSFYDHGKFHTFEYPLKTELPLRIWINVAVQKEDCLIYINNPNQSKTKIANEIVLLMDEPVISPNGDVLSLRIGSLKTLIEGHDLNHKFSYCLQFFSDD